MNELLYPKNKLVYLERASAYFEWETKFLKDHARTIDDCTKAIQLDPKFADAYCMRGTAYEFNYWGDDDAKRKAESTKAVADFTKSIEIDPKHYKAHWGLARIYFSQKEYTLVIRECTKIIELDPNYHEGYLMRASAYTLLGDDERAKRDAEQGEKLLKAWKLKNP